MEARVLRRGEIFAAGLCRHRPRASEMFGLFRRRGRRGGEDVLLIPAFLKAGVRVGVGIVSEGGSAEKEGSGDGKSTEKVE